MRRSSPRARSSRRRRTSPLGHVAILCRELGIPLVAGVGERLEMLPGRRCSSTAAAATCSSSAGDRAADPAPERPPAEPDAVIGTTELLLRMLARADPGDDPAALAHDAIAAHARGLGATRSRIVAGHDLPAACAPAAAALFEAGMPVDLAAWFQRLADRR